MLTLLHFSDIHFHSPIGGEQFNLDGQLRRLILDDVKSKPAGAADYDGLLVCGDVAFGGKKEQYDQAEEWLRSIEDETGIEPAHTYVVPGNHDVDREIAMPGGFLCLSHAALRACGNEQQRQQQLHTLLTKEKNLTPLTPLAAYNVFAQKYGCRSLNQFLETATDSEDPPRLAWTETFPKPLDDGSRLRLHGLNSALISDSSDSSDASGLLYVSQFQTQHLQRDRDFVELVMCHHPTDWLLDKQTLENAILSYASVALFGHVHVYRPRRIDNTVHIFSGATHPSRNEPGWRPTYHVVQLEVRGEDNARQLLVRVHSRVLGDTGHNFIPLPAENGASFAEMAVDLPQRQRPQAIGVAPQHGSGVSSSPPSMSATSKRNLPAVGAFRELRVHFHRLSTPVRLRIATELNLIRDGDDLPPEQLWDLVFQRAKSEERLGELWNRTAAVDQAFAVRPNPFS